ncbi:hypothetical protein MKEN_00836200 [Mycena kentingensis (nom. inval.)]|nr:hypothetical protein MKEN_00836200 [Mycena kentingensis (nom. inval.)]
MHTQTFFYTLLGLLCLFPHDAAARVVVVGTHTTYGLDPTVRTILIIVGVAVFVLCIAFLVFKCYKQSRRRAAQQRDLEAGQHEPSFLQQQEYAAGDEKAQYPMPTYASPPTPAPPYAPGSGAPPTIAEPPATYTPHNRGGLYAGGLAGGPGNDNGIYISGPMMMPLPGEQGAANGPGFRRGYLPRPGDRRPSPSPARSPRRAPSPI